ncbi:hypothetical protein J7E97_10310 [Streptomyces sp. ISL-66]|uniref:hypothetical protein n=1 Tax=Streptomyces sp. ISL-66 TaxID=2819186 RepID=UPI001BEA4A94|nr:hypothetical protein [Streptomyces sp. ISL-66]MBT2468259.1 hypothetical protein [Streptomyces sp. ISL-66]
MRDPHSTPLAAAPECRPEHSALPCCPVCHGAPERISWRQRPGQPVVLVFDPCGHRHTSPAAPILAVGDAAAAGAPATLTPAGEAAPGARGRAWVRA